MVDSPILVIGPFASAPTGYGGQLCDERPPGCGKELEATDEWKRMRSKVDGSKAADERDGFVKCHYWIKAPAGKRIEVKIVKIPANVTIDGCRYAGVEIKTHPDQRRTGYRFCSTSDVNVTLSSNSSVVPVITYSRRNTTVVTKLEYRYV
ncbi:hypothetical protein TELCIR_05629 [Teladorsagia circumcincta]|uniref:CUB domain-containing protein n=1 Tax=Teladorsagia circumcincta TaxID=45464 RepID=A0A2G9UQ96_TELCI|nr:hypothetical protein TELCIR_05629 [Teladorsagia circumcincta]